MGGRTGLDYPAVYPLLDRMCPERTAWLQMLDDLQAMEFSAIEELAKKED